MRYKAMVNGVFFERVDEAEAAAKKHGLPVKTLDGNLPRVYDGRPGIEIRAECSCFGHADCPNEVRNPICNEGWKCVVPPGHVFTHMKE